MRIYVTETSVFEKSEKSVVRFVFGDDCTHSFEEGFLFLFGLILDQRKTIFPKDVYVKNPYFDGCIDKVLNVEFSITIK